MGRYKVGSSNSKEFFCFVEYKKKKYIIIVVILGRNGETDKKKNEIYIKRGKKPGLIIKLLCETFGQLEWIFVQAQLAPKPNYTFFIFFFFFAVMTYRNI